MKQSHARPMPKADPAWKIGIVASYYYKEEMEGLVAGAKEALLEAGLPEANILLHEASGSFEVPLIGAALAESKKVDALIGFGIIVEGKTHHARLLAENVARAFMDVQMKHLLPFAFEILYVNDIAQAQERSAPGPANKGREGAHAALHSLAELKRIRAGKD
jgi:6,7-dimethyl-8-ribityllumazine synthase